MAISPPIWITNYFEALVFGKCRADCPFVDVLPADDPPIRENSIVKANKIFDTFKMGYIKKSLIQTKGVAAKKALVSTKVDRCYSLQEKGEQVTTLSPATFVAGEWSLNDKN
nr:hypothetical protein [Tanacetum cinerariifolium]